MKHLESWLKLCVFNFFIVSAVGTLMRYKMALPLEAFHHKFLQEAHSHFAFYGWVTTCLYVFIAHYLSGSPEKTKTGKYVVLLLVNLFGAYGMLASFMYGGYFWLSIVFSSVSLFSGFAFFVLLLNDTRKNNDRAVPWFRWGAFFAVLSSVGIFLLAYMSARDDKGNWLYRAATYFYLHFQYNGFFLFSCIGLLIDALKKSGIEIKRKLNNQIFYLLASGAVFGVGLSFLWLDMPLFLYLVFVLASLLQLIGIIKLWKFIAPGWKRFSEGWSQPQKLLFLVAGGAVLAKFIMQSASAVPMFAKYAFDVQNIVIAYLHLVLLVGISGFLIWKILSCGHFSGGARLNYSVYIFIFGILLNEIILIFSGAFSVFLIPFRWAPYLLLFASVLIMVAILGIFMTRLNHIGNNNKNNMDSDLE